MRIQLLLLAAALTLVSCKSKEPAPSGSSASAAAEPKAFSSKVGQVKIGVTTRAEALELFGGDPTSGMLPQDHVDLAGKLPPETPEGKVERLIFIGNINLKSDPVKTEMLFLYVDSAGKVCLISYDEPW